MPLLNGQARSLMIGIAVGIGAVTIARELLAPMRKLGRPLAKAVLKSGMAAVDRGRVAAARAVEQLEDLTAEIEEERNASVDERA
jgi:hypothetical protein